MYTASSESKSYGLKYQARCIAAQGGKSDHIRFLAGSLSLREENEVHVLQYTGSGSDITCEGLYAHPHEIWELSSCPYDGQLLSTVYCSAGEYGATLWRIPKKGGGGSGGHAPALDQVAELKGHKAPIKCVLWCKTASKNQVVSLDEETLRLWDFREASSSATATAEASAGELQQISGGCWNPHDDNSLATATETAVTCWDLRSMSRTHSIEQAHAMQTRDIDFNPKREHGLLTAGDDSKIRFWDLRFSVMPLLELPGHSHWTWRARYNPFHDELVLSCGTDTVVNLWHAPSVSASNAQSLEAVKKQQQRRLSTSIRSPPGSPRGPLDELVQAYTEHEDSVYGIAWSGKDPWVFASLSYDGRVTVDSVPLAMRKKVSKSGP